MLDDLRRGAVILSVSGLACGVAIRALGATRRPLTCHRGRGCRAGARGDRAAAATARAGRADRGGKAA